MGYYYLRCVTGFPWYPSVPPRAHPGQEPGHARALRIYTPIESRGLHLKDSSDIQIQPQFGLEAIPSTLSPIACLQWPHNSNPSYFLSEEAVDSRFRVDYQPRVNNGWRTSYPPERNTERRGRTPQRPRDDPGDASRRHRSRRQPPGGRVKRRKLRAQQCESNNAPSTPKKV